ncbi:FtsX-like permease family protein [Alloiococcus sp. CFN-8]|uniref:ABC transporter permease n=1 Tax=Alloiococcus sp. CFN-8 TaxID=3416081 RepID=UPI003CEC4396
MIILKIAAEGMRGRKKETALLLLVILLSFSFIVSATMFYGGIAETEENSRLAMYGKWQAAYLSADKSTTEYLKDKKILDKVSINRIVDRNTSIGVLGTIDDSFLDIGNLSIVTGKIPKEDNEIALELSALTSIGLSEENIGKPVEISSEVVYTITSQQEIEQYYREAMENLSPQDLYGNYQYYRANITTPVTVTDDSVIYLRESYVYFGPSGSNNDDIVRDGFQTSKTLLMYHYYTLTGIIDSYSHRWDTGDYPTANGFITEDGTDKYYNIIKNSSTLGNPEEILKTYPEEYNVFMYSSSTGKQLYDELFPGVVGFLAEENNEDGGLTESSGGEGKASEGTWKFRKNNLAYLSEADEQKERLIYTVMAAIFIISAISIFQLYLSQTRKRARSFALLKSIGATNSQVVKVFLCESIMLLIAAMPIGILLGIVLSFGAEAISKLLGVSLVVKLIPSLAIQGALITMVSLFIGMISPMFYALSLPLTGTVEKPPKHRKSDGEESIEAIDDNSFSPKRALKKLNKNYSRQNRGKSILALSMSFLICLLLLASVLLSYISKEKYIDEVLQKGKPDYVLELLHGYQFGTSNSIKELESSLANISGVKDTAIFWKGNDLHLYFEGMEDDKILEAFKESLPTLSLGEYFASHREKAFGVKEVDSAFITNFYSPLMYYNDMGYYVVEGTDKQYTDEDDLNNVPAEWHSVPEYNYKNSMERIIASITEGTFDDAKFWQGEEVILLMPMYSELQKNPEADIATALETSSFQSAMGRVLEEAGRYKLSLNEEETHGMKKNEGIKVGDSLWISANEERMVGEVVQDAYTPKEVKVGGIIRYFPGKGVWPFSDTNQSYGIIGSPLLMSELYVGFGMDMGIMSNNAIALMNQTIAKVKLGRTVFYFYTDKGRDPSKLEARLQKVSEELGGYVTNFREDNELMLSEARNNTAILALLCVVSAALGAIILYNSLSSRADQDKKRTGILQAIGVTEKQLRRTQLSKGIRNGIISIIASHLLLAFSVYLLFSTRAASKGLDITIYLNKFIEYYPFYIHIAITIIYFIITIFIYTLPTRRIIKNSPVENIRG